MKILTMLGDSREQMELGVPATSSNRATLQQHGHTGRMTCTVRASRQTVTIPLAPMAQEAQAPAAAWVMETQVVLMPWA
jgi:hypothetical protein